MLESSHYALEEHFSELNKEHEGLKAVSYEEEKQAKTKYAELQHQHEGLVAMHK